jgi:RNA polymerase sigma-70 factor (sigma-E family)
MITVVGTSADTAGARRTVDRDQAIERLFRDEYRSLLRLVALLVDDSATAEDVVQDAFVKLHRAWSRVRTIDDAPAYLRSIAMNTARSRLRRRLVSERHQPEVRRDDRSAEDDIVVREDQRDIVSAVRALPRRQRECVALRYYLGLSEAEIAAALGISPGSVKSHTHRAMAALASTLEEHR